jgi:hypothetical protein
MTLIERSPTAKLLLLLPTLSFVACSASETATSNQSGNQRERYVAIVERAGLTREFAKCEQRAKALPLPPGAHHDATCMVDLINARRGRQDFETLCRELAPGFSGISDKGNCYYLGH